MAEVCLKAGEIVELDDGSEWKVLGGEPFVRGAMRHTRPDVETPHARNLRRGGVQRVEQLLPVAIGETGLRPEQNDVNHHLQELARGSSRFSFSTSVVRFRFSSLEA